MALIGLQTFTVSSFEFRQNMKMQTASFTEMRSVSRHALGDNAAVLSQAATESKTFPKFRRTWVYLVCLTTESHWKRRERLPQATAGICVSANSGVL